MSRLKAHWGDPPKPNLWQVDSSLEFVEVTSPFLADGSILLTSPGYNGTDRYQIEWLPSPTQSPNLIAVLDSQTYREALRFFLSPEGWRKIKEKDLGVGWMFTHKVASSSLRAQWGNPPKPNIWQVKIKEDEETVEVTSPILKDGGRFELIRITPYKTYWNISFLSSTDSFTLTGFKADSFEEARDFFLSPRGWGLIKHFRKPHQDIFKSKVASSSLRAQWGDPPKPNLWKVTDAPASNKSFSFCMVSSPIFKDNGYLQLQWDDEDEMWIVYYNSDTVKDWIVYMGYDYKTYREARDTFLSRKGWKNIKKGMIGHESYVFSVPKIASQFNLNAQWGNPPKPNLWEVVARKDGAFPYCQVTSPVLKNNGVLHLRRLRNGEWAVLYSSDLSPNNRESFLFSLHGYDNYGEALDLFLSEWCWRNIVDTVEKLRMEIFSVPKVASQSNLKAMWGDPPKPNLWKVTDAPASINDFSYCMVSSPIFKDNGYLQLQWDKGDDIWIVYYSSDAVRNRLVYLTGYETYAEARDDFLSRRGWERIKNRMPDIFSVPKVASKDF